MAQITRLIQARGEQKVVLDVDLAMLYGVSTGALNRAVKRNTSRFPADFMFQVTPEEAEILKRQFGISSWGVAMLSSVLRSERAVVNIAIMRAFAGKRMRLACWRWRPRDRELVHDGANYSSNIRSRRFFSPRRRKGHARRVCSPDRTCR